MTDTIHTNMHVCILYGAMTFDKMPNFIAMSSGSSSDSIKVFLDLKNVVQPTVLM